MSENHGIKWYVKFTQISGVRNFNSSDDLVVRASANGAVDLGLIPSRVKETV